MKCLTCQESYNLHWGVIKVIINNDGTPGEVSVRGTLDNIRKYVEHSFNGDKEQELSIVYITSAFVMALHHKYNVGGKRTRDNNLTKIISFHKRTEQFIGFLSGAGGTGKTQVINIVKTYFKTLCDNLSIKFDRRTIVVTKLTGSTAVAINGETTHSACRISKDNVTYCDKRDNTIMVIVDKISFVKKIDVEIMSRNLNLLKVMG